MRDKRDGTITCVFCRDLHLTLMFSGLYKKICLKESEVWRKVISNKIIVMLVTCHTRFAVFFPLPSCPDRCVIRQKQLHRRLGFIPNCVKIESHIFIARELSFSASLVQINLRLGQTIVGLGRSKHNNLWS